MYEPVADSCVTILPKYNTNEYPEPSDDDSHAQTKESKNNDNRLKAKQPPEKPPRRIRLQKLQKLDLKDPHTKLNENRNLKNCLKTDDYHIDLEDVNKLTFDCDKKNFIKNRYVSVSVQTSPTPPYRLRILPKRTRKRKSDPEKCDCNKDKITVCCLATSRIIFSQCGLTIVIIIWALLGAAAFHETEGNNKQF